MPVQSLDGIYSLLAPERIRIHFEGGSKKDVLKRLVELVADHEAVDDAAVVEEAVLQRERVMSTGVGKGLGLPHAKTKAVRETVAAFAVIDEPVEFGAIDSKPVRLLFLLVGPEDARAAHIKILSRISRLMNREAFRTALLNADSSDEVLQLFVEAHKEFVGR